MDQKELHKKIAQETFLSLQTQLNIGFLSGGTVLLGSFIGDFLYYEYGFKYSYIFNLVIPVILVFILKYWLKLEFNKTLKEIEEKNTSTKS